jgi:hypothetical protein
MVSSSFYQYSKPLISFLHCFPLDTLTPVVYDPHDHLRSRSKLEATTVPLFKQHVHEKTLCYNLRTFSSRDFLTYLKMGIDY